MKGWNLDIKSSLSTTLTGMRVILATEFSSRIELSTRIHCVNIKIIRNVVEPSHPCEIYSAHQTRHCCSLSRESQSVKSNVTGSPETGT